MGFAVVCRPGPLHRRMGKIAMPSRGPATPPPASLGGTHHFIENCLDSVDRQCLGSARPRRLLEASNSQIWNPLTQQPHGHMARSQLSGDLLFVFAICGKQSDAGPPRQFLWSVRRLDEAQKFSPSFSEKFESKLWKDHVQKVGTCSAF